MDIEKFLESLSKQEYIELEKIVLDKKIEFENAELKILDFIETNKNDMSFKVKNALLYEANKEIYINKINKARMLSYKSIGAKTLTELEWLLRKNNIDTTYFFQKYI